MYCEHCGVQLYLQPERMGESLCPACYWQHRAENAEAEVKTLKAEIEEMSKKGDSPAPKKRLCSDVEIVEMARENLKYRGLHFLTGECIHYCNEFDGMVLDESCVASEEDMARGDYLGEFDLCLCGVQNDPWSQEMGKHMAYLKPILLGIFGPVMLGTEE